MPVFSAAETWSMPKRELEEVSEPVTATPSQPTTGESSANAPPVWARNRPRVTVWPDRFIT